MTIDELKEEFGTSYAFNKQTGMAANSYQNWLRWGFIPLLSQLKIEKATQGRLPARIEDGEKV
jgi:hypothetical protein